MQVTIIGSGHVGTVLGRMLHNKGHIIRQVYSRTAAHAAALAEELQASAATSLVEIGGEADIYILCVTDGALAGVVEELQLGDKLLLHTSGATPIDVLAKASSRYGVLWPMRMIRKSMQDIGTATLVIDANEPKTLEDVSALADGLSDTVVIADDERRAKMHMLSSFVANFSNHLYHLAAEYCEREGLDFSAFHSIIYETARAVYSSHPGNTQAGPAFRGDLTTVDRHKALLADFPQMQRIYEAMTESLLRKNGHIA